MSVPDSEKIWLHHHVGVELFWLKLALFVDFLLDSMGFRERVGLEGARGGASFGGLAELLVLHLLIFPVLLLKKAFSTVVNSVFNSLLVGLKGAAVETGP